MMSDSESPEQGDTREEQVREANACISLGVGVGALGFGAGAIVGAVCPICYVVTPALIGVGLIRRHQLKQVPDEEI